MCESWFLDTCVNYSISFPNEQRHIFVLTVLIAGKVGLESNLLSVPDRCIPASLLAFRLPDECSLLFYNAKIPDFLVYRPYTFSSYR